MISLREYRLFRCGFGCALDSLLQVSWRGDFTFVGFQKTPVPFVPELWLVLGPDDASLARVHFGIVHSGLVTLAHSGS